VVRNVPAVESSIQEFPAGTEAAVGSRALTVRPGASVKVPMATKPAASTPGQPAALEPGDASAPSLPLELPPLPVVPPDAAAPAGTPAPPAPATKPAAGAALDPARAPLRFTDLRSRT
jgi:hypothetical protein